MNMEGIIRKKRDGGQLSLTEIRFWLKGYVAGTIPDYQVAALLMAIFWRGLNSAETVDLTLALRDSGTTLDLSDIEGIKADKHSTGGVGDKTTLVVAPIVAAAGLKMAKMSGRSLGFSGGTLDKLESIPGFRTDISPREFTQQVRSIGLALAGQTAELAPADKLIYALRDVTATVDSPPLIASSVMSKKLAVGADVLVLDVKYGSGAFMKEAELAYQVARVMVAIGREAGQRVSALVTAMEQPLGFAVGNALEVREALQVLQGQGPPDLRHLSLALAAELLLLAGQSDSREEAYRQAAELLDNGAALGKFVELVEAQGGSSDFSLLPLAPLQQPFYASKSGYLYRLDAELIGRAALALGAGRRVKGAKIDAAAGIVLQHKLGEHVRAGEALAVLHTATEERLTEAEALFKQAVMIGTEPPEPRPLIEGMV